MGKFQVLVVEVGAIKPHAQADRLSWVTIQEAGNVPVVFRTGDLVEGQLAVYFPIDSVIPESVPGTSFLGSHRRIRAMRLRGMYSEGLILPAQNVLDKPVKGQDVSSFLGVKKHEDPIPVKMGGEQVANPGLPTYEVESLGGFPCILSEDEDVVITEKLHGTNARFALVDGRFYAGSHHCFWRDMRSGWREWKRWGENLLRRLKKETPRPPPLDNVYWQIARKHDLEEKMYREGYYDFSIYGEIFGDIQDLKYGHGKGEISFYVFDVWDSQKKGWLGWDDTVEVARRMGLAVVPVLYRGAYHDGLLKKLVDGDSILASHIREGIVLKTTAESEPGVGRFIIKMVSQQYKLRNNPSELK
jgi:RNA ligase (TIGR02306 family)